MGGFGPPVRCWNEGACSVLEDASRVSRAVLAGLQQGSSQREIGVRAESVTSEHAVSAKPASSRWSNCPHGAANPFTIVGSRRRIGKCWRSLL